MNLRENLKLKYNGSSKISTISKIVDDVVHFTDNSRAKVDVVMANYSELDINDIINENKNNTDISNYDISSFIDKPDSPVNTSAVTTVNDNQPALHPDTLRWMKEQELEATKKANEAPAYDKFFDQFDNADQYLKDTGRIIDSDKNKLKTEYIGKLNRGEITMAEYERVIGTNSNNTNHNVNNNIISKLPKMRKTNPIKINLVLNERISNLDNIRAVESLFDDVSIIEELGKEIASKYLNDRSLLEDMIISELQKKVKPVKKRINNKKSS